MVLNYDNNNGFYSVFDNLKKQIPEVSSEANKFFDDLNKLQKIHPNRPIDFEGFIKGGNIADESLISFIKTTDSSKISLANYQSYLQSTFGEVYQPFRQSKPFQTPLFFYYLSKVYKIIYFMSIKKWTFITFF